MHLLCLSSTVSHFAHSIFSVLIFKCSCFHSDLEEQNNVFITQILLEIFPLLICVVKINVSSDHMSKVTENTKFRFCILKERKKNTCLKFGTVLCVVNVFFPFQHKWLSGLDFLATRGWNYVSLSTVRHWASREHILLGMHIQSCGYIVSVTD